MSARLIVAFGLIGVLVAVEAACGNPPNETPPNYRVAFIGDQGLFTSSRAVLQLIKDEATSMLLVQGDLGYGIETDPQTAFAWEDQTNDILGPDYPLFASIGNHDRDNWLTYQQLLMDRLDRISGATCTDDYGENSACTYQGLFFILSASGDRNSELINTAYIRDQLAQDDSIWSICSWHHNQRAMQVVTGQGKVAGCVRFKCSQKVRWVENSLLKT